MYARFAEVYDQLMMDLNYPAWADYYLELIRRAGVEPKTACECACGTGLMTLELSGRGIRMTGVDLSADMLQQATIKARAGGHQVAWVRQDMRNLELHKPVDAVLCPCDGVNYLTGERDVTRFFAAAFRALRPGGVLAFDISSEEKLRRLCAERIFFEDLDGLTYLWQNQWDEDTRTVQMELCFFLRRPDGLYARFDEHQVQRAHQPDALIQALKDAGFGDIRCLGDRSFDPPGLGEQRIHFSAIRQ